MHQEPIRIKDIISQAIFRSTFEKNIYTTNFLRNQQKKDDAENETEDYSSIQNIPRCCSRAPELQSKFELKNFEAT